MHEEIKEKEFYYKFRSCFDQYRSKHMADYFPKVIRFIAVKLFQFGLITREKQQLVELDHMTFFIDDYFTSKHYMVGLQSLVADIIHAGGDVYRIIYRHQYSTYTNYCDIWKEKANIVKERDGYTCENCGIQYTDYVFPKLDAHHTNYDRVYGELITDLQTLCRSCHQIESS